MNLASGSRKLNNHSQSERISNTLPVQRPMKPIIGVIHLKPLQPPMHSDFSEVLDSALRDARALEEGGVDALLIENFGDKPFLKTATPETVASMTAIAKDIAKDTSLPLGINVLRNDAIAALAIAKMRILSESISSYFHL